MVIHLHIFSQLDSTLLFYNKIYCQILSTRGINLPSGRSNESLFCAKSIEDFFFRLWIISVYQLWFVWCFFNDVLLLFTIIQSYDRMFSQMILKFSFNFFFIAFLDAALYNLGHIFELVCRFQAKLLQHCSRTSIHLLQYLPVREQPLGIHSAVSCVIIRKQETKKKKMRAALLSVRRRSK